MMSAAAPALPAFTPGYPTCRQDLATAAPALAERIRELVGLSVPCALGELTLRFEDPDLAAGAECPLPWCLRLCVSGTVLIRGKARTVAATLDPGEMWENTIITLDGRRPRGALFPWSSTRSAKRSRPGRPGRCLGPPRGRCVPTSRRTGSWPATGAR